MASDHIWNDLFEKAVDDALKILNNSVVVFGIKPSYPETVMVILISKMIN